MDEAQARLGALYDKQGRISRFSSKAARDNYLKAEIKGLKTAGDSLAESLEAAEAEVATIQERIEDVQRRVVESRDQVQEKGALVTRLGEEIVEKNARKAKLVEQRK